MYAYTLLLNPSDMSAIPLCSFNFYFRLKTEDHKTNVIGQCTLQPQIPSTFKANGALISTRRTMTNTIVLEGASDSLFHYTPFKLLE